MKKRFFIGFAVALMVSVLCLGFTSCGGGDEDEPTFSLKGSVFSGFFSYGYDLYLNPYKTFEVLRFYSDTECEVTYRKDSVTGEIIGKAEKCSYTVNYPKIKITFEEGDSKGHSIIGTFIDANTFRSYGIGGSLVEYQRQ